MIYEIILLSGYVMTSKPRFEGGEIVNIEVTFLIPYQVRPLFLN